MSPRNFDKWMDQENGNDPEWYESVHNVILAAVAAEVIPNRQASMSRLQFLYALHHRCALICDQFVFVSVCLMHRL